MSREKISISTIPPFGKD